MVKNVVVACDGSKQSAHAVLYAASHLCWGDFKLHLVSVLPPIIHAVSPAGAMNMMCNHLM